MPNPERPEILSPFEVLKKPRWFNQRGFTMKVEDGFDPNNRILKINGVGSFINIEPLIVVHGDLKPYIEEHRYIIHFYNDTGFNMHIEKVLEFNRSEVISAFNLNGRDGSARHKNFLRYNNHLNFSGPKTAPPRKFDLSIYLYGSTKNAVRDYLFIKEAEYLNFAKTPLR